MKPKLMESLCVSSQYDFERGVMVETKVELAPKDQSRINILPRLRVQQQQPQQRSENKNRAYLSLKRFFKNDRSIDKQSKLMRSVPDALAQRKISNHKTKLFHPILPIGYYNLQGNETTQRKSVIDMSKMVPLIPINKVNRRQVHSQMNLIHKESEYKRNRGGSVRQSVLELWVQREIDSIKEKQRFQPNLVDVTICNDDQKKVLQFAQDKIHKLSKKQYYF